MASRARALLIPFLVGAGTCALLVLIVVLVTGGFVIDAGPLRLSARRPTSPLVIAVAAWAAAALFGLKPLAAAAASVFTLLERHALALALGARLHSRIAGVLAAGLLATSPNFLFP